jgi:L-fucose isomerase-like protein
VVASAIQEHFPWDKACVQFDKACSELEKTLDRERFVLVRPQTPFEQPGALLSFLEGELAAGIDGLILFHAAYAAGEFGSQLGRWLLDHPLPLLSWSHPEPVTGGSIDYNSLCGQNFLLNMFHRLGVKYFWVHAEPGEDVHPVLQRFARTTRARSRLLHGRVLHVGGSRVPGFYDGETDELSVMQHFGLRFDRVDLETVHQRGEKFSSHTLSRLAEALVEHPRCRKIDVPHEQIRQSLRFGLSILDIAATEGYLGATVKSWPDMFECYRCAIDGAISVINDFGLCAAEEGEMNGLLSSLALHLLSEGTAVPTMMDLSGLDPEKGTIWMWHTGACPTRLMRTGWGFEARRHSILEHGDQETAVGLNLEFPVEVGPVTVLRYQSPDATRMLSFEGEVVDTPMPFRGNFGELRPAAGTMATQIMGTILNRGLDHHWSFGYGSWNQDLEVLNHWLGVRSLGLDEYRDVVGLGGETQ